MASTCSQNKVNVDVFHGRGKHLACLPAEPEVPEQLFLEPLPLIHTRAEPELHGGC